MRLLLAIVAVLCLAGTVRAQDQSDPAATDIAPAASAAAEGPDNAPDQPGPPCGTRPLSIARMTWPAAAILAEIHSRILTASLACTIQVVEGDLAATGSTMSLTGEPAVAPELWVSRIPEIWNGALANQAVRRAGATYDVETFEGWFLPGEVVARFPDATTPEGLKAHLAELAPGARLRFISCPPDWACALINRNMLKALGLEEMVDVVEPANRVDMDRLIAEAVSRKQPVLFYYWQPNAVLSQFEFKPVALPPWNRENYLCLGRIACPDPKPSGFPPEPVIVGLAERVYTDTPMVAAYFARARMPMDVMNRLLLDLQQPGATVESVADRFVAEDRAVWSRWVGQAVPPAQ